MTQDDDTPLAGRPEVFPRNLEPLSIEALEAYLVELDAEKARVAAELRARDNLRGAAEDIFRKG